MPKVSAVIPSRNRPELVCRAVKSVLNQTMQDLEVVVVVDGPDPVTIRALEQFGDPRVRIIPLEQSVGGSEARNIGAHYAYGEWVGLLDDDDEWLPTKLEKQLRVAVSATTRYSFVVCSNILRAGGQDSIVPTRFPHPSEPMSEYLFGAPRQGFQTSAFFCSRELFVAVPWTKLKGLQDIDWFLRVLAHPEVTFAIVEEPLSVYWMETQATITSGLGWQPCFEWGREHRHLMTAKAYSFFLAKVCVHRARRQKAGLGVWLSILKESLLRGSPTLRAIAMFAGYSLVPYGGRRYIGNLVYRIREFTRPEARHA
jgi:glycosyltransferase involved in cell wall biosynthesis